MKSTLLTLLYIWYIWEEEFSRNELFLYVCIYYSEKHIYTVSTIITPKTFLFQASFKYFPLFVTVKECHISEFLVGDKVTQCDTCMLKNKPIKFFNLGQFRFITVSAKFLLAGENRLLDSFICWLHKYKFEYPIISNRHKYDKF